jgi:phage recombination protein Bet
MIEYPEALKGELRSMGFLEKEGHHVITGVHNDKTYGVDFRTGEIFRFEDLERITEDAEDSFLNRLKEIAEQTKRTRWGNNADKKETVQEPEETGSSEGEESKAPVTFDKRKLPDKAVPEITMEDITNYICPYATEKEAYMFLQLCKARNLNPFTGEAHLIKYNERSEATTVVGKDAFTRRAEEHPSFDGFEAGIILKGENAIEYRQGTLKLEGEVLVGGWSKVFRKDRTVPVMNAVNFEEYVGKKKDGSVNKMWKTKPCTMIRKVALVQSLREAFPSEFGGCYDSSEMGVEL